MCWDAGRRGNAGEEVQRFVLEEGGCSEGGAGGVKGRGVSWFVVLLSRRLSELQHLSVRQLSSADSLIHSRTTLSV